MDSFILGNFAALSGFEAPLDYNVPGHRTITDTSVR